MSDYNGWSNYETWALNLWVGNDNDVYDMWREMAQEAFDKARDTPSANARLTGVEPFTQEERATFALAESLKEHFETNAPEMEGVYADLLNAALGEVNWHEIAAHMIAEVDKTETATA